MARPGTDPTATDAAATLRGLRVVALAVALALLALVIDARSRPPPPEPMALLPVPLASSRPSVPLPAPPSPPGGAEPAASEGGASPAPARAPGEREPAPAAEHAPTEAPPAGAGTGEPAATGSALPPQPGPTPSSGASVRDGVLAYQAGDFERALAIWRLLAEAGDARARFHLGALLLEGRFGPSDPAAAYRWLALAAEAGQTAALPLRDQAAARLPVETVGAIRRDLGLPP